MCAARAERFHSDSVLLDCVRSIYVPSSTAYVIALSGGGLAALVLSEKGLFYSITSGPIAAIFLISSGRYLEDSILIDDEEKLDRAATTTVLYLSAFVSGLFASLLMSFVLFVFLLPPS